METVSCLSIFLLHVLVLYFAIVIVVVTAAANASSKHLERRSSPTMNTIRDSPPDHSRASTSIAVVSTLLSVTFIIVSLRVYTRTIILAQFGLDDYASVVSFVLVWVCGFLIAWSTRYGLGRHTEYLTQEQHETYLRTFYVLVVFYNAAIGSIKMTFLLQYYRVFAIVMVRRVIIGASIITGVWSVSQVFLAIFPCTPVSAFWDNQGRCIGFYPFWYINAAGNIITDLIVLILPLPVIKSLKLARRQKIILFGVFCLGFFVCAISFVRIRFLQPSDDFTWTNVETSSWSIGELCAGLICVCLPTLRPFVSGRFPGLLSSRRTASHKTRHAYPSSGVTGPHQVGPIDGSRRGLQRTESNDELYRMNISRARSDSSRNDDVDGVSSARIDDEEAYLASGNLAQVTTSITGGKGRQKDGRQIHDSSIEVELEIIQATTQGTEVKNFS